MWFTYPKEFFPYIPQMLLLESFKQYYSYSPKLETNQINVQHYKVWSIHIVYYKAKKKDVWFPAILNHTDKLNKDTVKKSVCKKHIL